MNHAHTCISPRLFNVVDGGRPDSHAGEAVGGGIKAVQGRPVQLSWLRARHGHPVPNCCSSALTVGEEATGVRM